MALVNHESFNKIEKNTYSVHKPASATYTVFTSDEKVYFQIDTYGTAKRVIPGKISQSIQFDKKTAELLIELLRQEFELD